MEAERTIKPTSPSVWGNTNILALRCRVQGIGSSFFGRRPRETAGHYARTTFLGNVRGEVSKIGFNASALNFDIHYTWHLREAFSRRLKRGAAGRTRPAGWPSVHPLLKFLVI